MGILVDIAAREINDVFPQLAGTVVAPAPCEIAATPQKRPAAATPLSDHQMRMVLDVSRLLAVPTELDSLLVQIAEICTAMLSCERASIFLYDSARQQLWTKVALGSAEIRVPSTAGIVGHAFTHNEQIHVSDPYHDSRFNPEPDRRSGFVTRNLLTCPMIDLEGKPVGAIQAVNKRARDFDESDIAMTQLMAEQAGVALQRHHLQLAAMESVALRHEMELARKAQQALIPKDAPRVPGIDAVGWTLPASLTGGDCFDLWKTPDGRLGILLADASGHGLAPAMVVAQVRTLVRALSELEPDPHQLLVRVNARLAEDLDWGQFVTAFLGFLSPDGTLRWTSAGHGPVFVCPGGKCDPISLDPPVQPLGIVSSWMEEAPAPMRLDPGGSLVLVSDGIFEAINSSGEMFGIPRMLTCMDAHRCGNPADLLAALRDEVRVWHGSREPLDDQTIVIVRREA